MIGLRHYVIFDLGEMSGFLGIYSQGFGRAGKISASKNSMMKYNLMVFANIGKKRDEVSLICA